MGFKSHFINATRIKKPTSKTIKLLAAALTSAFASIAYFNFGESNQFSLAVRCWKSAKHFSVCYGQRSFDFTADIDGFRYEGNTGNQIDKNIFFYGAHEKPVVYFLQDIMRTAYSGQGFFLDIGANTGQHSMFLARYASSIHAFEPWEPVLRRLRRHIEINRINNVTIHPFGLGNENSSKPFYAPPEDNLGMGSFVKEFGSPNPSNESLEIRIGDDVLEQSGVRSVDLIKMDIEGYEKLALHGLARTLRKYRPIVEFELTANPQSQVSIKSLEELTKLFPDNYGFLTFSNSSDPLTGSYFLIPMENRLRFDQKEQHDVVAYPIEKQDFVVRTMQNRR